MRKCCICGEEFEGYGNNPAPFNVEGKCCNFCNDNVVLPVRVYTFGRCYALLIKENTCELLKPNNKVFTLQELQNAVGGSIQFAPTKLKNNLVIVNEEGLIKGLYSNKLAAKIIGVKFVGNVLLCPKELIK